MRRWRDEMPKHVWLRLVKSGRVAKELNECAPVIDRCLRFLDERVPVPPADPAERVNVLDLCSGFGYLGMFLSECLDPERCQRIVLVDKQWPMHGDPRGALPHQINWNHVYGCEVREGDFLRPEVFEDPERVTRRFDATEYYAARGNNKRTTPGDGRDGCDDDGNDDEDDDAQKKKTPLVPHFWRPRWPVPLATRKMDVKQAGQLRQMERHVFQKHRGPFVILAVHLCGTLSIKAVEMFNHHPTAAMFALKPCCLPSGRTPTRTSRGTSADTASRARRCAPRGSGRRTGGSGRRGVISGRSSRNGATTFTTRRDRRPGRREDRGDDRDPDGGGAPEPVRVRGAGGRSIGPERARGDGGEVRGGGVSARIFEGGEEAKGQKAEGKRGREGERRALGGG